MHSSKVVSRELVTINLPLLQTHIMLFLCQQQMTPQREAVPTTHSHSHCSFLEPNGLRNLAMPGFPILLVVYVLVLHHKLIKLLVSNQVAAVRGVIGIVVIRETQEKGVHCHLKVRGSQGFRFPMNYQQLCCYFLIHSSSNKCE